VRLVAVMLVVIVRVGATIVHVAGCEGGDDAVYERLHNKYYDAYLNLFWVATDNVLGQPPLSIKLCDWSGFPMKVWKGKGKLRSGRSIMRRCLLRYGPTPSTRSTYR
jgi:hypothetical protein